MKSRFKTLQNNNAGAESHSCYQLHQNTFKRQASCLKNRNKPQATGRATTTYQSQHASHYYHPHMFSSPLALSPISFSTHYVSLLTPQPSPTKPANHRPHHTPLQDPSSHDDIITHHSHIPETKLRKQLPLSQQLHRRVCISVKACPELSFAFISQINPFLF